MENFKCKRCNLVCILVFIYGDILSKISEGSSIDLGRRDYLWWWDLSLFDIDYSVNPFKFSDDIKGKFGNGKSLNFWTGKWLVVHFNSFCSGFHSSLGGKHEPGYLDSIKSGDLVGIAFCL